MSSILSNAYYKIYGTDKQIYRNYWVELNYRGYLLDDISIIEIGKQLKQVIIATVKKSLEGKYKELDPTYLDTIIYTTTYDSGFLMTPLEAIEILDTLADKLDNYKLLSTHVSPLSIKERLRRIVSNDRHNGSLSQYMAQSSIDKLLPNPEYDSSDLSLKLEVDTISEYFEKLYKAYIPSICTFVAKGYNRQLIYQTIRSNFYLYLKIPTMRLGNTNLRDSIDIFKWDISDIKSLMEATKREITYNYYEPLLFTRIEGMQELLQGKESSKISKISDITNIAYIDYADTYSKVVRIANIRRRLLIQDMRYIVSAAMASALRHIYTELYLNTNNSI